MRQAPSPRSTICSPRPRVTISRGGDRGAHPRGLTPRARRQGLLSSRQRPGAGHIYNHLFHNRINLLERDCDWRQRRLRAWNQVGRPRLSAINRWTAALNFGSSMPRSNSS
jgi:hypothetical protein